MAEPTPDHPAPLELAGLTAEIVSAYLGHHTVAVSDLEPLIVTIGQELAGLNPDPAEEAAKPEPAVPIKRSVRKDQIICLVCGQPQKLLKRHLTSRHDLTPDGYRDLFGLKADYPMTAPSYAALRSDMAKKIGLGRKPEPRSPSKSATAPRKRSAKKGQAQHG